MKTSSMISYFFKTGSVCHMQLTKKLPSPLNGVWMVTSRRNYQLPVAVFEGEMKLKKKDNVALDSEIIYRMPKSKRFASFAIVTNVKVIFMPLVLGIIFCERNGKYLYAGYQVMDFLSESIMFMTETQCYTLGSIMILLGTVLNRYLCYHPLRIYAAKNSKKFTAVYMNTFLPWRSYKYEFTTVKPSFMSVLFDGKRAILQDDYFKTHAHRYQLYKDLVDSGKM